MSLRRSLLAGVAVLSLASGTISTARANLFFTGSGSSGNFTGQASEPFTFNNEASPPPTTSNWGSPGVGAGETPYLESPTTFGFEITFTGGGTVDAPSIAIGNAAACVGAEFGGTTFCTNTNDIWQAFLVGPDTIEFLAQNPTFDLVTGQDFFVNVFFDGATPTKFSGAWLTEFSPTPTPLPAALPLFATGLGAMGLLGWRRKRKNTAAIAAA